MNKEISELLDKVDYTEGVKEPPAKQSDILLVIDYLRKEFDITLPRIWIEFWQRTDGIICNGLSFYRAGLGREVTKGFIDSFIEVNKTFKEISEGEYVFFGYADDVAAYVYHIPSRTWQDVNPIGYAAFETYSTPEELLITILNKYLEM